MFFIGHHDEAFHVRKMLVQLFHQRQEGQVHEDELVLGVVDDVNELFCRQARIHGVTDGTHAGGGVVDLQVAVGIPGNGTNPVFLGRPELLQGIGQLTGTLGQFRVGIPVNRAFGGTGYNFLVREVAGRKLQDLGNQQGALHHQAMHRRVSFVLMV